MQELTELEKATYIKISFSQYYKEKEKPFIVLDYQTKIIVPIFFQEHKRIVITSTTRAGKSYSIALTALLMANLKPNFRIKIIAPTSKQTKIIMGYIYDHIMDNDLFIANTSMNATQLESLGKTLSQNTISFLNGSSIDLLSAEGEGARLMGWGGDLVICDESSLMDDEVFRTRILRMLGDNENSVLVEIGNPLEVNHFYEHFMSPLFHKVHISWEECVKEGRMSQQFIDEQRALLLPIEFKRLYDAEFVVTQDDSLYDYNKIQESLKAQFTLNNSDIIMGIDLARFGVDWNVVSVIHYDGSKYVVKELIKWHGTDLMQTAGRIKDIIGQYKPKYVRIDESGLGGGVIDRLREQRVTIENINFGTAAKDPKRFLNTKAEAYCHLRELLQDNKIQLISDAKLIDQMIRIKFKFSSEAKLKIDDEDFEKSQDELDSLVIGLYSAHTPFTYQMLSMGVPGIKKIEPSYKMPM